MSRVWAMSKAIQEHDVNKTKNLFESHFIFEKKSTSENKHI